MAISTFALLLCVGCGKSNYEKAVEQMDKNMKQVPNIKEVEETWEEAREELQKELDKIKIK